MNELRVETDYDAYYPGTEIQVSVYWNWDDASRNSTPMQVRLVWNTAGKGDRDLKIVQVARFFADGPRGEKTVTLKLPWGPYSFSGKLISLIWAIEVVGGIEDEAVRKEIVIGPGSEEVLIGEVKKKTVDELMTDKNSFSE